MELKYKLIIIGFIILSVISITGIYLYTQSTKEYYSNEKNISKYDTHYTYSINGVKYKESIIIHNKTNYNSMVNVVVINSTTVSNDKDSASLIELMREDGSIFTRIVDTTDKEYNTIGNIVKMDGGN